MKLLIIDPVANIGGSRRFTGCLVRAIYEHYPNVQVTFATSFEALEKNAFGNLDINQFKTISLVTDATLQKYFPEKRTKNIPGTWKFNRFIRHSLRKTIFSLSRQLKKAVHQADVIFFPMPDLFTKPPAFGDKPLVITIHDLLWKNYPSFPESQQARVETNIKNWFNISKIVVTITKTVENALQRNYPNNFRSIKTIRHAVPNFEKLDPDQAKKLMGQYQVQKPYFFYPASLWIHKNHQALVQAWHKIKKDGIDLSLVCCGAFTDQAFGLIGSHPNNNQYARDLRQSALELGLELGDDLIGFGIVSEQVLTAFYTFSQAVILPSREEGCDFPLLEAAWFEKPVLCSNIPAHQEMAEYYHILPCFFNPFDPNSIYEVIRNFLDQSKNRETNKSNNVLKTHTWKDVAREYITIFESVI